MAAASAAMSMAEQSRADAEDARAKAEAKRDEAETARMKAEIEREKADSARQAAAEARDQSVREASNTAKLAKWAADVGNVGLENQKRIQDYRDAVQDWVIGQVNKLVPKQWFDAGSNFFESPDFPDYVENVVKKSSSGTVKIKGTWTGIVVVTMWSSKGDSWTDMRRVFGGQFRAGLSSPAAGRTMSFFAAAILDAVRVEVVPGLVRNEQPTVGHPELLPLPPRPKLD